MTISAKAFKYGDDINTDYIISGKYKFKSNDMEVMAQLLADGGLVEHFKKHGGFAL